MSLEVRGEISNSHARLYALAGAVALITIWCFLTYGGHVKSLFLPSPTDVWEGALHFNSKGWLIPAVYRSTVRVTMALLLVVAVGAPIGILMGAFTPINAVIRPILNAAQAVPPTGLVGLIILWFSVEEKAKIVFLFLGSFFYLTLLVANAVSSVRDEYVRVAKDIGASNWLIITKVLIPGALPTIWDSIIVCNGIMWTYIVLAEYINSSEEQIGLGFLLQVGSRTFQSGQVYATLIIIAAVASSTFALLGWVKKTYFNW